MVELSWNGGRLGRGFDGYGCRREEYSEEYSVNAVSAVPQRGADYLPCRWQTRYVGGLGIGRNMRAGMRNEGPAQADDVISVHHQETMNSCPFQRFFVEIHFDRPQTLLTWYRHFETAYHVLPDGPKYETSKMGRVLYMIFHSIWVA